MDDLRLTSLLCTRLCHDLVGPVGAMNNGMELLSDTTGGLDTDVVDLLRRSAGEAARRLRFFRAAFGQPDRTGDDGGIGEARMVAQTFFEESKITLDWPGDTPPPAAAAAAAADARFIQLLLNMVLCAAETLPRGGEIAVRSSAGADGVTVSVAAAGPAIKVSDALRTALAGTGDFQTLDARSVQPFLMARLAAATGATLGLMQPSPETAEIAATFAGAP